MATDNERREGAKQLVFGLLWIVGACWICYAWFGNPLEELALIRHAQVVPGLLIDSWEDYEDGPEGGTHWFYGYTYSFRLPDGREFTSGGDASGELKDEFRDLQEPYPIEVEYLPDDPTVSRIRGNGTQSLIEWLWRDVGLGGLLLILFASPGIVLIRKGLPRIRKARYIGEHGDEP